MAKKVTVISKIEKISIFEQRNLIYKPKIMKKSFLLFVIAVGMALLASCSKDTDICECAVITVEETNYRVSACAPDIFFDGRATPKQARIREAQDNCK